MSSEAPSDHQYQHANWIQSRAPCPALNALANHGYIPRSGTGITFANLVGALQKVYNLSLPLALLLSIPAFLIYGKFRMRRSEAWPHLPRPAYTLDLASLAVFGPHKIAHPASLVHPDHPSFAPDPDLLRRLLSRARGDVVITPPATPIATNPVKEKTEFTEKAPQLDFHALFKGLTLAELAQIRVEREAAIAPPQKMDHLHNEIALGECGLMWLLMRAPKPESTSQTELHIPYARLAQWLGEEKLPDGWFEVIRPKSKVGVIAARKEAKKVAQLMDKIRESPH